MTRPEAAEGRRLERAGRVRREHAHAPADHLGRWLLVARRERGDRSIAGRQLHRGMRGARYRLRPGRHRRAARARARRELGGRRGYRPAAHRAHAGTHRARGTRRAHRGPPRRRRPAAFRGRKLRCRVLEGLSGADPRQGRHLRARFCVCCVPAAASSRAIGCAADPAPTPPR